MLLRETIRKTKLLLHKTLRNFKSFIFGGYQKLPRSLSFNPFLGRSGNTRTYTSDQFYNEFYDILQSDLNRINRNEDISMSRSREHQATGDTTSTGGSLVKQSSQKKNIPEDGVKEKKSKGNSELGKKEDLNSKDKNEGAHDLAQKMKELEMMDSADVEHVLDIEEALHYYSRLTSPVYLDIVDKFFTDMHSEFSLPQSSVRIKHSKSKGRLGSIRL
ncbi:hypothetical protein SESBI_05805 [Sesbania bispinosa]|nr:hypothetical protein SESBI_05805 [Sesbania bispinosa]